MRILRNDLGGFAMLLSLVMCSFLPIVWFFKTDLRGMIGSSVFKLLLYPVLGEMGDGEAHEDNTSNNQGATLFFVGYFFLVGIVLANLLICMINNRYDDIIDDADRQYITKRMMSIRDRFSPFRCLPPPFNLRASITGALRRDSMHQCRDEREQHFMFNLLSLTVFLTTAVALVQAAVIMSPCLQDLLLQWLKNICQQSNWFSQGTGCAILVLAGYHVFQSKSVAGAYSSALKVLDPWRLFRGDLAVATVVFLALAIPLGHLVDSDGTVPSVNHGISLLQGAVFGLSQYHNMTWLILGLVGVGYYNVQDPTHSEIANAKKNKRNNSDKMASILKKAKGIASLTSERDKVLAQKQHADTEKLMEQVQKLQEQVKELLAKDKQVLTRIAADAPQQVAPASTTKPATNSTASTTKPATNSTASTTKPATKSAPGGGFSFGTPSSGADKENTENTENKENKENAPVLNIKSVSSDNLESLGRKELQARCKALGIRANGTNATMVEGIRQAQS
jgi:hypothetical protein